MLCSSIGDIHLCKCYGNTKALPMYLQAAAALPGNGQQDDGLPVSKATAGAVEQLIGQGLAINLKLDSLQQLQHVLQQHHACELRMHQILQGMHRRSCNCVLLHIRPLCMPSLPVIETVSADLYCRVSLLMLGVCRLRLQNSILFYNSVITVNQLPSA